MSKFDALRQTKLCAGLVSADLNRLFQIGTVRTYQRDEVVFLEGDICRDLYIVLHGSFDALIDPAKTGALDEGSTELKKIRQFYAGDSFGEMALLGEKPRTASIVCTQDKTKVLVISSESFQAFSHQYPDISFILVRNIALDVSDKIRETITLFLDEVLANYFVRILYEELLVETAQPDAATPVTKKVIIRDSRNFILTHLTGIAHPIPDKEDLQLFFFSTPGLLNRLVGEGEPTGEVILNVLFSLIRCGRLPSRCSPHHFSFHFTDETSRRSGNLTIRKLDKHQSVAAYSLHWEIKGARFNAQDNVAKAALFIRLHINGNSSTARYIAELIEAIDMPVQQYIYNDVRRKLDHAPNFRIFTVHHRTHEVAKTLQTLHNLGFKLDTFVGIPYGEINWSTSLMLDAASNHNYMCLKATKHPTDPTRYDFDFLQSSFISTAKERELAEIFSEPNNAHDYLSAMQALITYRLEEIILTCEQNQERLLIYEDGAYVVPLIYQIYNDSDHHMHQLIKSAIDNKIIAGAVEVTTSGDRKNQAVLFKNNGHALMPVLSTARDDLKLIYEAIGVAEAILNASSTALGNLGLPTFLLRRVAVLGGNGAIGIRLVEQLALAHHSTSHIFSVDIIDYPPARPIPYGCEYAKTKVYYRDISRYPVANDCLPVVLDMPLDDFAVEKNLKKILHALDKFFSTAHQYRELALTNSFPLPKADMAEIWQMIRQKHGFELMETSTLPLNRGMMGKLANGNRHISVIFLAPHLVLNFRSISRLIHNGVDAIIGITGVPTACQEADLDAFFTRQNSAGELDTLVLISGSSKDYEFKPLIRFLDRLLAIQTRSIKDVQKQLTWFAGFYQQEMSFVKDEDFQVLQSLFSNLDMTADRIQTFSLANPILARKIGITGSDSNSDRRIADYVASKIRSNISIRKELRSDIGTIYALTVNNMKKQIILLADGFVVNFYARYEKGVKTEYIDPIVTMQLLGLLQLSSSRPPIVPGLYAMKDKLNSNAIKAFWSGLDEKSKPLPFKN